MYKRLSSLRGVAKRLSVIASGLLMADCAKQPLLLLLLCTHGLIAQDASLAMPPLPDMPSMPSMPTTDEPMPARRALEARSGLIHSNAPSAPRPSDTKAKSDKSQSASIESGAAVSSASPTPLAPSVPAPSPTSPISSFGAPLSDYSDIDALLQRLSATKDAGTDGVDAATAAVPPQSATELRDVSAMRLSKAVLRFVINGSDIRGALRNVHFSTTEADGSFLLTAERRYWSGGTPLVEPFYLLFASQGPNSRDYTVTCSVVQETPGSVLCRLSGTEGLTAVKTGNLVAMRATGEGLLCDLLLDIGK